MRRFGYFLLTSLFTLALAQNSPAAGKARHVVVVVWDGMRPDFVTPELTPNLWELSRAGVTFQNHHPVYPSATEVNGTALATGVYPGNSGIIANKEFRPAVDPLKSFGTEAMVAVRKADQISQNHYLRRATVAEILQKNGFKTAVAGTKPVALLHDRLDRAADFNSELIFEGRSLPTNALSQILRERGPFPKADATKIALDDWTTATLTENLWGKEMPRYSLLWLGEPDFSQHATGVGSGQSIAAIRSCDRNLGRVLQALEARGVREKTDVLVMSDHGFSTISRRIDLAEILKQGGFHATREFKSPPAPGDVMVVGNGGAVLLYVIGREMETTRRLVEFLQDQDFTGVLFTREKFAGTFSLEQAHLDSPDRPDVLVSFRWNASKNSNGAPGLIVSDGSERGPGQGMHVTLSRFDMHNILFAAGPDFKQGVFDSLPSGNMDIAPTILWLLGVNPPEKMDGRVLSEALKVAGPKLKTYETGQWVAEADRGNSKWRQYLSHSEVNGVIYFDEGNGEASPK